MGALPDKALLEFCKSSEDVKHKPTAGWNLIRGWDSGRLRLTRELASLRADFLPSKLLDLV